MDLEHGYFLCLGGGGVIILEVDTVVTFIHCVLNCVNLVQILEGLTLQMFVFVYVLFYFYICVVDLT